MWSVVGGGGGQLFRSGTETVCRWISTINCREFSYLPFKQPAILGSIHENMWATFSISSPIWQCCINFQEVTARIWILAQFHLQSEPELYNDKSVSHRLELNLSSISLSSSLPLSFSLSAHEGLVLLSSLSMRIMIISRRGTLDKGSNCLSAL